MTAETTKAFMALCSIVQHFGRPGVPTDQAPIQSFWGHIKADWAHLNTITDPDVLGAELERVRGSTTGRASTPPSATSPPTTNTKVEATPSARAAKMGSLAPTSNDEQHADHMTTSHRPERPHDAV